MQDKFQDSLKAIARNRDFQTVVQEILDWCNYDQAVFNGNSRDAYWLGKRAVAVELLDALKHADKEALASIMKERAMR